MSSNSLLHSVRRHLRRDNPCTDTPEARPAAPPRDDRGSSLVLALLFLGAIGMIVGAIASWTANDLQNTLVFQTARQTQTALSSASNVAIQSIRYTPMIGTAGPPASPQTLNANPPAACWGTGTSSPYQTPGLQPVDVWCSTVWNPASAATRVVTVTACMQSADNGNATTCINKPGLQTVVTFDDYSSSNPVITTVACTPPPTGTCGSGMTVSSSLIGIVPPTVTGISSTTGATTGGGTLTVTGAGFVTNQGCPPINPSCETSVNFVGTNPSQNLVLTGTAVTVASPTSLTVAIPAATTVTTYNVVVTTPNGSSATGAGCGCQYKFTPVIPKVTGVTTSTGSTSGSAAGGDTLSISGTGFLSSAAGDSTKVAFVDTQNFSNVYYANASSVSVNAAGNVVTAVTPAIPSTDLTYYVVVQTAPGGTSATGPTFTFQPFTPVVASVFQTSGAPGASVTLTGVGFVAGATTVQLVPTGSGSSLNMTSVSVSNSTTLTATVPTGGTANRTYYVEVTTTTGGSSGSNGAPVFTWI